MKRAMVQDERHIAEDLRSIAIAKADAFELDDAVALIFGYHRVLSFFLCIDRRALVKHRHPGLR
jgi:hypothetical protein